MTDISPEDLDALQRLRLARRRHKKLAKEVFRASNRAEKARRKIGERATEVVNRGLSLHDPRSLD